MKVINKYPLLFVLLIACVILLSHLSILETNIMEARNFISAREMISNNNWLLTTLNELPRYEKPPLPTWITAVFGYVFGFENLFFLRIPVVLSTLLLIYWFFKLNEILNFTKVQVVQNSLILITSFYIFFSGRDNNWDMYTHSFMTGSLFYLVKHLQTSKKIIDLIVASVLLGFSFLSKGPVSLYALLLPFLLSYFIVFKISVKENILKIIYFLLIGIAIGTSWYIYVRVNDPTSFIKVAVVETSRWGNYNTRPFYYYWSFFIQSGLWTLPAVISLFYPYFKNKVSNKKLYQFSFFWTLLVVIFLSIIPEKKSRYLLPVLIPLAINIGFVMEYFTEKKVFRSPIEKTLIKFFFLFFLIICISIPIAFWIIFKEPSNENCLWFAALTFSLLLIALYIAKNLFTEKFKGLFYALVSIQIIILLFGFPLVYTNSYQLKIAKNISLINSIESKNNMKTYSLNDAVPEIIYYYGKPIPLINLDSIQSSTIPTPFGIITSDENIVSKKFGKYQIDKIATLNFNNEFLDPKKISERLIKNYYIVQLSVETSEF